MQVRKCYLSCEKTLKKKKKKLFAAWLKSKNVQQVCNHVTVELVVFLLHRTQTWNKTHKEMHTSK